MAAYNSFSILGPMEVAVASMGKQGVVFGSDFDGFLGAPRPRWGNHSCRWSNHRRVHHGTQTGEPSRGRGVRYRHYPSGTATVLTPDGGSHSPLSGTRPSKEIPLALYQPPLEPSQSGTRTFDVNVDGAVHIGMLPAFFQLA